MQSALHAATSTLPHLRRGLSTRTAEHAVPHLRELTGAAAIALADTQAVLSIEGEGREQVRPGDLLSRLLARTADDRMHIEPRLVSSDPRCPLRSAVMAPLIVQETGRNPDHLLSLGRATEPRRAPSRAGGGEPCVRTGRAVGDGRAGGADRAGRVARAPGSDLPALHLQRAGGGRRRHPRPARGGSRAPDRLRGVHPIPVPRRALVRDPGRGARACRALPAAGAGPLSRQPAHHGRGESRGAVRGRAGHVGPAAGGERRAPWCRAAGGHRPRRGHRPGRRR